MDQVLDEKIELISLVFLLFCFFLFTIFFMTRIEFVRFLCYDFHLLLATGISVHLLRSLFVSLCRVCHGHDDDDY